MADTHFNELTPAQAERLALLAEELGEAQQAIGKILRHGYASRNPSVPDSLTNRQTLEGELGDVSAAITMLIDGGDLKNECIRDACARKLTSVREWLHHG